MGARRLWFPNLDGLRTLAFGLVFLQHGFHGAFAPYSDEVARVLFARGGDGVCLFFVLSGFLITHLALTEVKAHGKLDVKSFLVRRALRIWPLYFTSLALIFCFFPLFLDRPMEARLGPFLWFTGNFEVMRLVEAGGHAPMALGVMWSIAIEEQFYLFWPIVLRVVPLRFVPWVCGGLVASSVAFRGGAPPVAASFHTLANVGDLALGALAACLTRKPAVVALLAGMPRSVIGASYAIGGALFVLAPEHRLLLSAFYAFVIVEQCFCAQSFFKLSTWRTISALGTYTYGLYLLHPYPLTAASRITTSPVLAGGLALVVSVLLAVASHHLLERPFLRLKRRFDVLAA